MAKWLALAIALLPGAVFGADAPAIALLPGSPEMDKAASLALAELPDGAILLERGDVEKALAERKLQASSIAAENVVDLGKTLHADLFAIVVPRIVEGKEPEPSRLLVYDARIGSRLLDAELPGRLEAAAKAISKGLSSALSLRRDASGLAPLSIAVVRDAGVPDRFKYKISAVAENLERSLLRTPGVALLERDFLEGVVAERRMGGELAVLVASARLLNLEFSQSSDPSIVDLSLRISDVHGKEISRKAFHDAFKDSNATVAAILNSLEGQLKEPPSLPNAASAKEEAARFRDEFSFLLRKSEFSAARRKLGAAMALDPESASYRVDELILNRQESPSTPTGSYLYYEKNLALAKDFEADFPNFSGPLYTNSQAFEIPINWVHRDVARLREAMKELKPKYVSEFRRLCHCELPPDGKPRNLQEFSKCLQYWQAGCEYHFSFDDENWPGEINALALRFLKISAEFFGKRPELAGKLPPDQVAIWPDMKFFDYNYEKMDGWKRLVKPLEPFIELARRHPDPQVRFRAEGVALLRKTILADFDGKAFENDFLDYLKAVYSENPGKTVGMADFPLIPFHVPDRSMELRKTAKRVALKFAENSNSETAMKRLDRSSLFRKLLEPGNPNDSLKLSEELLPELVRVLRETPLDVDALRFMAQMNQKMSCLDGKRFDEASQKLYSRISPELHVELLAELKAPKPGALAVNGIIDEGMVFLDGVQRDGKLYLLVAKLRTNMTRLIDRVHPREASFNVASFDPDAKGPLALLSAWTPWDLYRERQWEAPESFALGDGFAAFFQAWGQALSFEFGGKTSVIGELPAKRIMCGTAFEGRLYAFLGKLSANGFGDAEETILFSCKPDGSERTVLFSTSRDSKLSDLDKLKPFNALSIEPDLQRRRLVVLASSNSCRQDEKSAPCGFYEYLPAENLFKRLPQSNSAKPPYPPRGRVGDELFIGSYAGIHFNSYNVATGALTTKFRINGDSGFGFFIDNSVSQRCGLDTQYPFFVKDNLLWNSTPALVVVNLSDAKASPPPIPLRPHEGGTLLNCCESKLFPASRPNSVLWLNARSLVRVAYDKAAKGGNLSSGGDQ